MRVEKAFLIGGQDSKHGMELDKLQQRGSVGDGSAANVQQCTRHTKGPPPCMLISCKTSDIKTTIKGITGMSRRLGQVKTALIRDFNIDSIQDKLAITNVEQRPLLVVILHDRKTVKATSYRCCLLATAMRTPTRPPNQTVHRCFVNGAETNDGYQI